MVKYLKEYVTYVHLFYDQFCIFCIYYTNMYQFLREKYVNHINYTLIWHLNSLN